MKKTLIAGLAALIFLFNISFISAEPVEKIEFSFEYLSVSDGLSSSSVSNIIQDRLGFLWFATQSGLNRYDGYSIQRYEHDPFDRNSLSHNLIQTMYYQAPDVLWLGTYGGLNKFNIKENKFSWFNHNAEDPSSLSNNVVVSIAKSPAGDLWVGTLKGLNKLNDEKTGFTRYLAGEPAKGELSSDVIRALSIDSRDRLWIGTYGGMYLYNKQTDSFELFKGETEDSGLPSSYVMSILPDPKDPDILWVGSWGGGISKVHTDTKKVETFPLPHNEIYTMMFDSAGKLWAGTWGSGVYRLDPITKKIQSVHVAERSSTHMLSQEVAYSFLEDDSGIIWIGTNGGGIYKYVPWENSYPSFIHNPEDPFSIAKGKVTAAFFDEDGTGWFGTYNGGLSRLDPETSQFTNYSNREDDPSSLSNNIVNVIYRDSRGDLWIGTNEGLNQYLPEKDAFKGIYTGSSNFQLPEDVIFEIAEDANGALWLGTNTSGVVVYNPQTDEHNHYSYDPENPNSLSDNLVRTIFHDSAGMTWVGTNEGINRFNPKTGKFERYKHDVDLPGATISSNNIREIHEDSTGRIWIATMGGGVSLYNRKTDSFTYLTSKDGLPSNHVLGIFEDKDGNLWFPTNRGIALYNPSTGTIQIINESNGLLSNELTKGSAQGPDGKIYVGSNKGLSVITDVAENKTKYTPPIVITEFSVLGSTRKLEPSDSGFYEPVILEYGDSFFSVEFSAFDFSTPEQNKYRYILKGFDSDWKQTNYNYLSYTNLDSGKYILKITGSGSRDNWNEEGISVPITVLPPWWRSLPAYFGYAVFAIAALMLFYLQIRKRRVAAEEKIAETERLNKKLDKKVQERTAEIEQSRTLAEQASKAKSMFLANMSHEIRTPLNGLMGMLSLLSKTELGKKQEEYLKYSTLSAENLNILVNDLLDFERIEAGKLKLAHEDFSIAEVGTYIYGLFANSFSEKQLTFAVTKNLNVLPETVKGDRNRLIQIITNLVSNALKYTQEGGASVEIGETVGDGEQKNYLITVTDSGIGIDKEDYESIFETFTQIDGGYTKTSKGVGLGLAIAKQVAEAMGGAISVSSKPGEGSAFTVSLPLQPVTKASEDVLSGRRNGVTQKPEEIKTADSSHVLICEDESINRLYLSRLLEELGFATETAENGVEAYEKAKQLKYDIILMDLGMPEMSGIEAAQKIRTWEQENGLKPVFIIALTAHTYKDDIRQCYEAGMNDFLGKPINENKLREKLGL